MSGSRYRFLCPELLAATILILSAAGPGRGDEARRSERPGTTPQVARPPHTLGSMVQSASPAQTREFAGALTLRNTSPTGIRIEVRLARGASSSCDDGSQGVVRLLAPGKGWVIAAKRPICWRRALVDPNGMAAWTPWRRQVLAAGQRLDATP